MQANEIQAYLSENGFSAKIENGIVSVEHHNCFFKDQIVGKVEEINQEILDDFIRTTGIIPTFTFS